MVKPSSGGNDVDGDSIKPPPPLFDFDVWQTGGGKGNPLPFELTCFEGYWDRVPTLTSAGKNKLSVNGYTFMGRMAVYKHLIEHTSPTKSMQDGHVLWGYGALLDWQARSGRLSLATTPQKGGDTLQLTAAVPNDAISPKSWWGYMNFMFSVSILLGAVEAGIFDKEKMDVELQDEQSKKLVEKDPTVKQSVMLWKTFWQEGYLPFCERSKAVFQDSTLTEGQREQKLDVLLDEMYAKKWIAHCGVFRIAVFKKGEQSEKLLLELQPPERSFAVGFCKIVDLLAALNVRTDLITTSENGVGYLPTNMVDQQMIAEINSNNKNISAIERKRQVTVQNMEQLYNTNDKTLQSMVNFWKRVGQWKSPRKNVAEIFDQLTHGGPFTKLKEVMRVLFFFALPASRTEFAVWTAIFVAGTLSLIAVRTRT